jgi:spore coat polysaccharide biosynthesis protein SpsF
MILGILQARMNSSRLPGKVLKPILERPMILRQIERLRRARSIDRLLVATSTEPSDDPLAAAVEADGTAVFRGSLDDVLGRFIGALDAYPAEHVVRLTADCPLADPEVVDAVVARHLEAGADYTNNLAAGAAYPKGQDTEVVTVQALRRAASGRSPEEREHVTWGIRHDPVGFRHAACEAPADWGAVRWTVDRPDDFEFVTEVYEALYPQNAAFSSDDVRAFVTMRPDLAEYGGDRRI